MIQATQDYSRELFLVQKNAGEIYNRDIRVIEPYSFQAHAPISDILFDNNQIVFFTELGYTCIDENNRTIFDIYTDFSGSFYTFQAEIATNINRFKISDKLTNRWCQSIRNVISTSYLYGVGYIVEFKN